jgi:putative transposase
MDSITQNLLKSVEDLLHYEKEDAIDKIVNLVFENIMKSERSEYLNNNKVDGNKCNGYYSRLLKSINKYYRLKVPRDRFGMFKPVFLEIMNQEETQLQELAFKLYVKGLSTRDIEEIFSEIYDKKFSPTSVSNITKGFEEVRKEWQNKKLEEEYYFVYVDALYVPIRRSTVEKEAVYIVLGIRKDLKRDILGVYNIPVESSEGWLSVLNDLSNRGVKKILMITGDGLSGLENTVKYVYPNTMFQKCLVHKIKRVILKVRSSEKEEVKKDFWKVFQMEDTNYSEKDGLKNLDQFLEKWRVKYPSIINLFKEDEKKYYFSYLKFPSRIQRMIYSTNWIERLNKEIRKTQRRRNSFPNPDSALNLICAALMDYEERSYHVHPVTSFIFVKDILDEMLEKYFNLRTQYT